MMMMGVFTLLEQLFVLPPPEVENSHHSVASLLSHLAAVFHLVAFLLPLFYPGGCKSTICYIHCQRQRPWRPRRLLIRPLEPRWASPLPLRKKVFTVTPVRHSRRKTKTASGPVIVTAGTLGGRFKHFRVLKIKFWDVLWLNRVSKTSWKNWRIRVKNSTIAISNRHSLVYFLHRLQFIWLKDGLITNVKCEHQRPIPVTEQLRTTPLRSDHSRLWSIQLAGSLPGRRLGGPCRSLGGQY